jgi:hypothetical protein
MEMFLMALALSLLGVTVSAIAFAAATQTGSAEPVPEAASARERFAEQESGFFVEQRWPAIETQVPIEVLLLQIERHVRLEHAAAEAFQQAPTADLLHSRTASPLVH